MILANPPYVDAASLVAFPPEFAAEPRIAHAGGKDGLDFVRRILSDARPHLNSGGALICEIGQGRGQLEDDYPDLNWYVARHQRERRRSVLHSRGGSAGVETQTTGLRRWPTRQSDERSD